LRPDRCGTRVDVTISCPKPVNVGLNKEINRIKKFARYGTFLKE